MKRLFIVCIYLSILLSGSVYAGPAAVLNILAYDDALGTLSSTLTELGLSYDVRNQDNPVSLSDLRSHSVLVVGWSDPDNSNYSGLDKSILTQGITGNLLLTGHAPDFHYYWGVDDKDGVFDPIKTEKVGQFLKQVIEYGQAGSGTGLVALCDYMHLFSYLPSSYGVSAVVSHKEIINEFTDAGNQSGIYGSIPPITPNDMSWWYLSYSATFTQWGPSLKPFEIGETGVVTLGGTVPVPVPSTIVLFSFGLIGIKVLKRKLSL